MTNSIRFLQALAVVMAGSWAAIAQGQFVPRVIYTMGEGSDGATAEGDAVTVAHDTAVWIEQTGGNAGVDVDYSTDFNIGTPTWSTDTRGPQSQYSLRVDGSEGISAPGVQWWNSWDAGFNFRLGVQAWIKPDSSIENFGATIPVMEEVVGIYIDDQGRWRYANNGNIHDGNLGVTWDFVDGTGDIAKVRYGEWQHVAARTDGSTWDVYVDGTKVSTTNSDNFTYGGSSFRNIGLDRNDTGDFAGWIDDVQWFWYDAGPDAFGGDTQYAQELLQGDTNSDGKVDEADYNLWRMNLGLDTGDFTGRGRIARGDVDLNGVVDLNDFRVIKENRTPGSGSFPVPEPVSLTLVGLSAVATLVVRRRRSA